jgi:hypothetical protein
MLFEPIMTPKAFTETIGRKEAVRTERSYMEALRRLYGEL